MPAPKPAPWAPTTLAGAWAEAMRETDPAVQQAAVADAKPKPLVQYQTDPEGFLVDVLGIPRHTIAWSDNPGYATHKWDGTPDPLRAILSSLAAWENVAVESATGTGKSFLAAGIILWFLGSWQGARVFTFAPKEDQLRLYIWAEMGKLWPAFSRHFPLAQMNDLVLYMDAAANDRDSWSAHGVAVAVRAGEQVATKAAGMHAQHMLLVTEETPGIHPAIFEAHENTCTAPHNLRLALGNPDSLQDQLHRLYERDNFVGIRISAMDHPNVVSDDADLIPGAVSRKSIRAREAKYGATDPMFASRVRGIPPDEAENALIKRAWVRAAMERYGAYRARADLSPWPIAYGVDPSNSDAGDLAAVARFEGPLCTDVTASRCPDSNVLGRMVWRQAKGEGVSPEHIGVDNIGVGAGTFNEINLLAPSFCSACNGGSAPVTRAAKAGENEGWVTDGNEFLNLRAQMHWQLREDLRQGRIALPDDRDLEEELVAATYTEPNRVVVLEHKDKIRARLGRSPNKADAVAYANWVRPRTVPTPAAVSNPDHTHLGFKKAGGKVRAVTAQDVFRDKHPGVGPGRDTKKFWEEW